MGLGKALGLCLGGGTGTVHRSICTSGSASTICSRALRRVAWGVIVPKLGCVLDIVPLSRCFFALSGAVLNLPGDFACSLVIFHVNLQIFRADLFTVLRDGV